VGNTALPFGEKPAALVRLKVMELPDGIVFEIHKLLFPSIQ
jgi:hypothetical protein